MRTFMMLALGLFISVSMASGGLNSSSTTQYWERSGLTVDFARSLLTNTNQEPDWEQIQQMNEGVRNEELGSRINSLLTQFDAHAMIEPREFWDSEVQQTQRTKAGVGFMVLPTHSGLKIRRVYPNSSAHANGLRVNDYVRKVNGFSVGTGAAALKSSHLIAGEVGQEFEVELERAGKTFKKKLKISEFSIQDMQFSELPLLAKRIGYVQLFRFTSGICDELRETLRNHESLAGWIVDLRDNTGGLMEEGRCVANLFLEADLPVVGRKNVNVKLPEALGSKISEPASQLEPMSWMISDEHDWALQKPLVVMINEVSASASEIVAGALRDYRRAWLVGQRSFGKGSAQSITLLDAIPTLILSHTTDFFYSPSGQSHQLVGISPDVIVSELPHIQSGDEVLREGELYPNSLASPDQESVVFQSGSPELLYHHSEVTFCADHLVSDSHFSPLKFQGRSDWQLAAAISTLQCAQKLQPK